MPKQSQTEAAPRPHALSLENRKTLTMTGVKEVASFDEKQLVVDTEGGRMTVSGDKLHVTSLLLEEGRMAVEGQIDALAYSGRGGRRGGLRGLFS